MNLGPTFAGERRHANNLVRDLTAALRQADGKPIDWQLWAKIAQTSRALTGVADGVATEILRQRADAGPKAVGQVSLEEIVDEAYRAARALRPMPTEEDPRRGA